MVANPKLRKILLFILPILVGIAVLISIHRDGKTPSETYSSAVLDSVETSVTSSQEEQGKEDQSSVEDEILERKETSDKPVLQKTEKVVPSTVIFEVISEKELRSDIAELQSGIPKNDGRIELLDENGKVIAADLRSPQEMIDLGYIEANKYKKGAFSRQDLENLAAKGDVAAHVELARLAYKSGDISSGDEAIIASTRLSGKPAAMSVAGGILSSPRNDIVSRISGAAWYLAAYKFGDYTVATNVAQAINTIPERYHGDIVDQANAILEWLDN